MRFVLINVESEIVGEDLPEYRMWPHLGILSVGSRIVELGIEVVLWDELVQGLCTMSAIVRPGDIVGLSLVATGIDRGVVLAREAKRCGASAVIAGNDSAIFRAHQLLQLHDSPFDAVSISNSVEAVAEWVQTRMTGFVKSIPGIATAHDALKQQSNEQGVLAMRDRVVGYDQVFQVPQFSLFGDAYWETLWRNHAQMLGGTFPHSDRVRNASALFAQGCTRAGGGDVCSYCTIFGVADIIMPQVRYLEQLTQAYTDFGITHVFNVTDSSLEMKSVAQKLESVGAHFRDGLTLYGRAWGMAHRPDCIEAWQKIGNGRLVVNSGFDSGNDELLQKGIGKASVAGSRLAENRTAIQNLKRLGGRLHCSFIFGIPGETRETCEETLRFFDEVRDTMGAQLQQCESDFFWLNHGSPASRVLHDYAYAQKLAARAGKEIAQEAWCQDFYAHRNTLMVPLSCQEAWYRHFTCIEREFAHECISRVNAAMHAHVGAVPGRSYAFKP